jgi:O-succinylbenzoic acid--CoA ligase
MTAIYIENQVISYTELLSMIQKCTIVDPIFPVTKTLSCVVKILTCLMKGIRFFPYSPLLPEKPSLAIPNDCDYILHTSGSVKMNYALFKKGALISSNMNTHPAFRLQNDDVYLLNLPLYHVAGLCLLMRAFLRGGAIAIDPKDPSIVTHISMVPAMTDRLFNFNPYPKLKALLLGGSHISKDLADKIYQHGYPLYITYGMTEMSSHVFVEKYNPNNGVSFSNPLSGREVKIDKDGLFHVKGCGKFLRYLDGEEAPYFSSKDRVTYDGRYHIGDRCDRMFISGGENIFPEEIERAALSHPLVESAHVEIVDHMKWGKRPTLTLFVKAPLNKEIIRAHLLNTLESFKVPKDHEIAISTI